MAQLQKLATFEPQPSPVVSLYLNLTANQHGRDDYQTFCRKAFADQLRALDERSEERAHLDQAFKRITAYVTNDLEPSSNSLALFASADLFDPVPLNAAVSDHWLFIGAVPHIYPLVRLIDQYPRYATVLVDSHQARILVFALGSVEKQEQVTGVKTRRSSMGGWSQARYQRRAENFHLHHIKEVADTLDRTVRSDDIQHLIIAGDDVATSMLKKELPAHVAEKIVDVMKLDHHAADDEILQATLEALRRKDAETDVERVAEMIGAWRGGGLGVAGPEATLRALEMGQVDELLIAGAPETIKPVQKLPDDAAPPATAAQTSAATAADGRRLHLSEELVSRAQQSGARVRIIEDPALLEPCGGVGALLRFRI